MSDRRLGAIVLAAGEAKRFGAAKQVLVWKGQTLVERAVQACQDASCEQIVVVTGAHREEIQSRLLREDPPTSTELSLKPMLDSSSFSIAHNQAWANGMHTSIVCGMKELTTLAPALDAAFIVLVDQPLIDAPFLRKLADAQIDVNASALGYPSGAGVPACFGESLFPRLLNLNTTSGGAKAILRDPAVNITLVNDPDRRRDIDTFADWNDFNLTQH
ncbi:MAG: NTP transferase domain-containing protein [Saprospiraceae bacterium]